MSTPTLARPCGNSSTTLPVNLPMEREILGAIIEGQYKFLDHLNETEFSLSEHRRVLAAIRSLRDRDAPIDYITVAEELGNTPQDVALIGDLISGVVFVPSHIAYMVRVVRKKSALRRLAALGEWLVTAACRTGVEVNGLKEEVGRRLDVITAGMEDVNVY